MTHEQKIKALIKAGEKAGDEGHADWFDQDDKRFYRRAANARDSIKLLAEIAEAAGEVRAAEQNMAREGNFEYAANADWGRKAYVLDALLTKYKEAQDAE